MEALEVTGKEERQKRKGVGMRRCCQEGWRGKMTSIDYVKGIRNDGLELLNLLGDE